MFVLCKPRTYVIIIKGRHCIYCNFHCLHFLSLNLILMLLRSRWSNKVLPQNFMMKLQRISAYREHGNSKFSVIISWVRFIHLFACACSVSLRSSVVKIPGCRSRGGGQRLHVPPRFGKLCRSAPSKSKSGVFCPKVINLREDPELSLWPTLSTRIGFINFAFSLFGLCCYRLSHDLQDLEQKKHPACTYNPWQHDHRSIQQ